MRHRRAGRQGPARRARPHPPGDDRSSSGGSSSTSSSFPPSTDASPAPVTDAEIDGGRRRARALARPARRTQTHGRRRAQDRDRLKPRARARSARRRGRHLRRRPGDRPGAADPDRRRRPHGHGARQAPDAHDLEQIAEDVCMEGASPATCPTSSRCAAPASTRPASSAPSSSGAGGARCRSCSATPRTAKPPSVRRSTNGRVDLVFRDGDELVVVDYKTDKDVTEETAEQYARKHHAGQGEVYAHGSRPPPASRSARSRSSTARPAPRCGSGKARSSGEGPPRPRRP